MDTHFWKIAVNETVFQGAIIGQKWFGTMLNPPFVEIIFKPRLGHV
jgi:hypothetical protein